MDQNHHADLIERPWQGTTLAIIAEIGCCFAIAYFISFIVTISSWASDVFGLIYSLWVIPSGLAVFFVARGIRKGQKWTLFIYIAFDIAWFLFPAWIMADVNDMSIGMFSLLLFVCAIPLALIALKKWVKKHIIIPISVACAIAVIYMMLSTAISSQNENLYLFLLFIFTSAIPFFLIFKSWNHPFYNKKSLAKNVLN